MKNYVAYNPTTGEIYRSGICDDDMVQAQGCDGLLALEGTGTGSTHYILAGELVAYSPAQAELKAVRPRYPAEWSNSAMQWVDLRTLDDLKAAQWETIKQSRSAAEYAGFTWDGSVFDSDATSQARITGAVTLAQMTPAFSVDWILADNSVRTLSQADMLQVGAALGAHVAAQFANGVQRRAQIEAAATASEVQAITWEQA